MPAIHRRLTFEARTSDFNEVAGATGIRVTCADFSQSVVLVFGEGALAPAFPAIRIWNPYLRQGDIWTELVIDETAPGRILLTLQGRVPPGAAVGGLRFPSKAALWRIIPRHRYVWLFCPRR